MDPVPLSLFLPLPPLSLSLSPSVLLVIYIQIYSRVQAARIGAGFKDKRHRRLFSLKGRAGRLPEWSRSIARSREFVPRHVLYIHMLVDNVFGQ